MEQRDSGFDATGIALPKALDLAWKKEENFNIECGKCPRYHLLYNLYIYLILW